MVETEGGLANKSRGGALLAGKPGPGSIYCACESQENLILQVGGHVTNTCLKQARLLLHPYSWVCKTHSSMISLCALTCNHQAASCEIMKIQNLFFFANTATGEHIRPMSNVKTYILCVSLLSISDLELRVAKEKQLLLREELYFLIQSLLPSSEAREQVLKAGPCRRR